MTLEEGYKMEVKAICAQYPPGSKEREEAKRALWEKFQADRFLRDGSAEDLGIIYQLQGQMAADFFALIDSFYSGKVPSEKEYLAQTIAVFRQYCVRAVELGLASAVPDDDWIAPFAVDGIKLELSLLPAKTTGFSPEDADLLCIPCRDECKRFLAAFHAQFGIGRLKATPDVHKGIDPKSAAVEAETIEREATLPRLRP
jgi:hypothetical protein